MLSNWKSCVLQLKEQYGECNDQNQFNVLISNCQIYNKFLQKNTSELEQLQNEKRKALLEHETAKLRECDDALQRELRDWKSQLHPRKQVFSKASLILAMYCSFSGSYPLEK